MIETEKTPSRRERIVLLVVVALATIANFLKVISLWFPWTGMWPQWAMTYRHGFIRRGLAGTVFQALFGNGSVLQQQTAVYRAHYVVMTAVAIGILAWVVHLGRAADRRVRTYLFLGTAALLLSWFFPTLGETIGYFDVFLAALGLLSAFLIARGHIVWGSVLAMPGPVVHEEFFFLWLPVIVCVATDVLRAHDRAAAARRSSFVLLPVIATVLTLKLHSHDALESMLGDLPPDWRYARIFEIPLGKAVPMMLGKFSVSRANVAVAVLYYGWPFAIIAACAALVSPLRRPWNIVFAIATTLAPCSILLVAWDLSRYLTWAGYGAFLALFWAARGASEPMPTRPPAHRWLVRGVIMALVLTAVGGPRCYSYFDRTYVGYKFDGDWQRHTPATALAYAFSRFENRGMLVSRYSLAEGCPRDAPNVHIEEGCVMRAEPEAWVESPIWGFGEGHYRARLDVEPLDTCLSGVGSIAKEDRWILAPPVVFQEFDATKTREVFFDFEVTAEEAAMGRSVVHVNTHEGCFRLRALEVTKVL